MNYLFYLSIYILSDNDVHFQLTSLILPGVPQPGADQQQEEAAAPGRPPAPHLQRPRLRGGSGARHLVTVRPPQPRNYCRRGDWRGASGGPLYTVHCTLQFALMSAYLQGNVLQKFANKAVTTEKLGFLYNFDFEQLGSSCLDFTD